MLSKKIEEIKAHLEGKCVPVSTELKLVSDVSIPEEYIQDGEERLVFYRRLLDACNADELRVIAEELRDRFGPLPQRVRDLLSWVKVRLLAGKLGISVVKEEVDGVRFAFMPGRKKEFFQEFVKCALGEIVFVYGDGGVEVKIKFGGVHKAERVATLLEDLSGRVR